MPGRSLVNKCWRSRLEGSSPLDRNAFNVPIFSSRRDRSLFGQFGEVDPRAVSGDVTRFFQSFHALQAAAGRKPDLLGKQQVADRSVLLQLDQDIDVDTIEFRQVMQ